MQTLKKAVDLTDLAVGIIILGITVAIGATILLKVRDARLTSLDVDTVTNETLTTVTEVGETLANTWVQGVSSCANVSNHETIAAANYSLTVDEFGAGVIKNVGCVAGCNNTNWECTYTIYNTTRVDWSLPDDAAIGLGEYGNWFSILVIVGVSALVLGLIFLAFGRGSSVGSSTGTSGIGGSY